MRDDEEPGSRELEPALDFSRTLDVVVRRTPADEPNSLFLLARGVGFIAFITGYVYVRETRPHPVLGTLAFVVALLAWWISTKGPPRRTKITTRRMPVTITADSIAFDGKTIPRTRIARTLFHPGDEGEQSSVRCLDVVGRIVFEAAVTDEAAGAELIRAFGRDAASNRTRAGLEARLRRGGRTIEEWRRALASLEHHDGYREAALRRDDLWRIVEDRSAPEDARVGAALVLRRIDDAPRLRVAAGAVDAPELRIALETAADPEIDDEELEKKLRALS